MKILGVEITLEFEPVNCCKCRRGIDKNNINECPMSTNYRGISGQTKHYCISCYNGLNSASYVEQNRSKLLTH